MFNQLVIWSKTKMRMMWVIVKLWSRQTTRKRRIFDANQAVLEAMNSYRPLMEFSSIEHLSKINRNFFISFKKKFF